MKSRLVELSKAAEKVTETCASKFRHLWWQFANGSKTSTLARSARFELCRRPSLIQKDAPMAWVGFPPNPAQAGVSILLSIKF